MNKKLTIVLASTAVAGGIALGASALPAMASTTSPTPSASSSASSDSSRPSVDGSTSADRTADIQSRIAADLAGLVADGTLTQDQADKVAETLASKMPAGGGHGGPGGRGGMGGGFGGLTAAATAIGVTEDDLRTELEAGKSIAAVAEANGVSEQTVIDAIIAEAKAHFADEVASGEHTQAEADQILSDLETRVRTMVETEGLPQRGGHGPDGDGGSGTLTPNTQPSASTSSAA
ncbi:MAG: hypothetical protein AB7O74_07765 [Candidatus Nanopelagicales bacterium]